MKKIKSRCKIKKIINNKKIRMFTQKFRIKMKLKTLTEKLRKVKKGIFKGFFDNN